MPNSFTYKGQRMENVTVLENGTPYMARRAVELLEAPGRPGAIYRGRRIDVLTIPLRVLVDGEPGVPFARTAEKFAAWLDADEPQPLIFDKDPNRTYYAILDGDVDPHEVVQFATVEITFVCPDPYRYGPESYADIKAGNPVYVRGSAPSDPITMVTLSGPTTFVAVGDGEDVNMVGTPLNADQEPYIRDERVMWDPMQTLTGWGSTNVEEESGVITGTIATDGKLFRPSSFGTGSVWHGPALKRTIGASLQDFKIEAGMAMVGLKNRVGAVHVLLLDAANNIVAKINILKNSLHDDGVWVMVRLGTRTDGRYIFSGQGENNWRWLFFDGRITLERVGAVWSMSAIRYTPERGWHAGVERTIIDRNGYATAPITQVQVNFWAHSTKATPTSMSVSDLKIYKVNQKPDAIPYIGDAGDQFEFDHNAGTITKNGIDITREKAFIGNYFQLPPGTNYMTAEPAEAIQSAMVRWRDRWN